LRIADLVPVDLDFLAAVRLDEDPVVPVVDVE
jgi:hypothetical protein